MRPPDPWVEFTVPGVPPSFANLRMHHQKRAAVVRDWRERCYWHAAAARVLAGWMVADKGAPKRQVTVTMYRHRLLDKDNAYVAAKPLIDSLKSGDFGRVVDRVRAGLIYDDSANYCDWDVLQGQVRRSEEERTVIRVEVQTRKEGRPEGRPSRDGEQLG